MIKARGELPGGETFVLFGLSAENVTRLLAGEPMMIQLAELGLDPLQVLIVGGRTDLDITAELEQHGMLPPGATETVRADLPEPGNPTVVRGERDGGAA